MHERESEEQRKQRAARVKQMFDMLPDDWDRSQLSVAEELANYLLIMADAGTGIDSGAGDQGQYADLWVTIGGIEYFITVRRSKKQLIKDGKLPPDEPEKTDG